ncbi:MAG: YifB family Mg chelatase-like AAA ATPase [Gaiellales bacterium]
MVARTHAFWLTGLDARRVEVEAHVQGGLPAFRVVGLADRSVQEARDRVRSGLTSAEFNFPIERLTVNLAPAQERKEGTGFDLAIALAVLAASGQAPAERVGRIAAAAELGLDGTLRPVRGAMAMAETAARLGLEALVMSPESAAEATAVPGAPVVAAGSLTEAVNILWGRAEPRPVPRPVPVSPPAQPDLADVRGQARARRALEIAAAGRHNLFMVGPPGSGKTMLANRLVGLMPPPSTTEAVEITRVHSASGTLAAGTLAAWRPFRAPHHSASAAALVGGASLRPGEATLAHRGVLFLDELAEFTRPALEALRVPLEERRVELARAGGRVVMPADCLVVAAMNPCPCGHAGESDRACTCSPQRLSAYRGRLSGPLLDRFDLRVRAPRSDAHGARGESSEVVAARVAAAWDLLAKRRPRLGEAARHLLERSIDSRMLSGRGAARTVSVSRTITALAGQHEVGEEHLAEALSYREPM